MSRKELHAPQICVVLFFVQYHQNISQNNLAVIYTSNRVCEAMSYFLVCNLLLFLFLVYADSACSQLHYYITPLLNVHCPGDLCLTLAQFATDSTSYLGSETNISLSILP